MDKKSLNLYTINVIDKSVDVKKVIKHIGLKVF